MPKSLTTTIPTFDGKSEVFELFQHLFQTGLKIHSQLTEDEIINYFHSPMSWRRPTDIQNPNGSTQKNRGENLEVFRGKYVKAESMATAKHIIRKFVFNPAIQELGDFLDELQKLAKNAFEIAAHAVIEQFIHAKLPPHLMKSLNQAHLEKGTYEQIATDLETELEVNGFEALDELQVNTVSQHATNTDPEKHKSTCYYCWNPEHFTN